MSWWRERPAPTPFLAAWYLALILLGEGGWDQRTAADVIGTVVLFTLTALGCWLVSRFGGGNRQRRTIASTLLVMMAGTYSTALLLLTEALGTDHSLPVLPGLAWLLGAASVVLVSARLPAPSVAVVRSLTLGLWILLGLGTAQQGWALVRGGDDGSSDGPVPPPQRSGATEARTAERPDIYVILLDKLGRSDLLAREYGVALTTFEDSLRRLGFTIPRAARTNYIHTHLVLATLLNWQLVHELDAPDTDALISDAALWTVLHARGYRVAFFPTGFPPTSRSAGADIVLRPPRAPSAGIGQTWRINTPFTSILAALCPWAACRAAPEFPYPIEEAASVEWKLAALQTLPDSAGPIIAFLHLLATHEPYILERDCTPRAPWWPRTDAGPDDPAARAAYADQVTCVTGLVLEAVTGLLRRSTVPPVIILQSDHGHGHIAIDPVRGITLGLEDATAAQVEERLAVFAAYRFPGADSLVPDTLTPVNVFPVVLGALFGSTLPRSPDRSYWSTYRAPFEVTEVPR